MASFQQQPPTRIKLRRDAIIHAIAFTDDFYAVGDDEALTVFDARTDRALRRFEDIGTVLSVCFVGDRVAAGTLRGLVAIRSGWPGTLWRANLSLAPASSEREGVRAIAATGSRLAAGDAAGRVCVWYCGDADTQPLFALKAAKDRTCAVEALALHDLHLVVARSALGATQVPLLSVWGLNSDTPPEVCWSSDEEEDGDASDDGDRFECTPSNETCWPSQNVASRPATLPPMLFCTGCSRPVLVTTIVDASDELNEIRPVRSSSVTVSVYPLAYVSVASVECRRPSPVVHAMTRRLSNPISAISPRG